MSRITKFLRQECNFEVAKVKDNGLIETNSFGETIYEPIVVTKCRREYATKEVQSINGTVLKSSTIYFTDETAPVKVDDRIDGRVVLMVEGMTNLDGFIIGWESYVE